MHLPTYMSMDLSWSVYSSISVKSEQFHLQSLWSHKFERDENILGHFAWQRPSLLGPKLQWHEGVCIDSMDFQNFSLWFWRNRFSFHSSTAVSPCWGYLPASSWVLTQCLPCFACCRVQPRWWSKAATCWSFNWTTQNPLRWPWWHSRYSRHSRAAVGMKCWASMSFTPEFEDDLNADTLEHSEHQYFNGFTQKLRVNSYWFHVLVLNRLDAPSGRNPPGGSRRNTVDAAAEGRWIR